MPVKKVSVAKSLAPFMIAYDLRGEVTGTSLTLDGKIPDLPEGLLDSTRELGENRVTWQPRKGIRVAAVIVAYKDGAILAGRNLREVEVREAQLTTFAGITWALALLATLVVIAIGEYVLSGKK